MDSGRGQGAGGWRRRKYFLVVEGRTREGRGVRQGMEKMVKFGTFNIWNIQNGGIESALRSLAQGRADCGILLETKITDGVYTQESSGFWVMMTAALSAHRGGVAIFYHEAEHFAIKELHLHGQNGIGFQLVMGRQWWNVTGCYIAQSNASTI